jgi:hypothetical protein
MDGLLAAIVWCVLFGLYLLFAGTVGVTEAIAGVVAASLATGLMAFVHAGRDRFLRLRPPLRALARPLLGVVTDSGRVAAVLVRAILRRPVGPVGTVVRQDFRQGGENADDAGRRGIVTLSASLAPNGYTLHIPEGENVMVMHRLAAVAPSPDREWPV